MVTEKNIDAIVRTFFDEWAHPKSYTGGDVDETSGKYEDRLNVGRITRLYAREAHVEWDGVNVDTTPDGLDVAVRARLPFIANGYAFTTQDREDGTTEVDITGWIALDASRPFQDRAAYVPQQGEAPFAERLIVCTDGLISEDLLRSGVTRIEEPATAVSFAPSQQEAPTPDAKTEAATPLSDAEAHTEIDEFLTKLYDKAQHFVTSHSGHRRPANWQSLGELNRFNDDFRLFFTYHPAMLWGGAPGLSGPEPSPAAYAISRWQIANRSESGIAVKIWVKAWMSTTSIPSYYLDTLTLVPATDALHFKVSDQNREPVSAFR